MGVVELYNARLLGLVTGRRRLSRALMGGNGKHTPVTPSRIRTPSTRSPEYAVDATPAALFLIGEESMVLPCHCNVIGGAKEESVPPQPY